MIDRKVRPVSLACAALALSAALAACGTGAGSQDDGPVELRFSWWGNDNRHATTEQILDLFEQKHPGITVQGEYTDWGGYWDKLATTTAAGDTPDVMTQEERYLREYGSRGSLANLDDLAGSIDTSALDPSVARAGELDGQLFGLPTGIVAAAILADPAVFAHAGVPMPDDATWSWDDYAQVANAITAGSPEGTYGAQDYGFTEVGFAVFARQRGEELYTADGGLGFSPETLAQWWQRAADMRAAGGNPPASRSVEINADTTQSLMATGTGGMGVWWTSQLGATEERSGRQLELLRMPGETTGERTGTYFKPSMYYAISADTEHPEEAALLVDFLLNDVDSGRLMLSDRGLPANTDVRAALDAHFTDADRRAAQFLTEVGPTVQDGMNAPPIGAGEVAEIFARLNEQVLFGRLDPRQAAEGFMAEVEGVIG
ncbi:ABC transporter substrate-binding protein [Pseudonocardia sichuanensis]